MGAVQKGDYVRVVLEGEVCSTPHGGDVIIRNDGASRTHVIAENHATSIEVLPPPVEYFKPGDRIRAKVGGYELTLANEGLLQHYSNGSVHYHNTSSDQYSRFNSDDYELVTR